MKPSPMWYPNLRPLDGAVLCWKVSLPCFKKSLDGDCGISGLGSLCLLLHGLSEEPYISP